LIKFELLLKQLDDMGFQDRKKNIELLVKHGANLELAVQELLGSSLLL